MNDNNIINIEEYKILTVDNSIINKPKGANYNLPTYGLAEI